MNLMTTQAVKMTSLQLVDFINSNRKDDEAILRHDSFMLKIPKVIGKDRVHFFLDTYKHPQNGQIYPCYSFPKREACLMAMSYSYELQAKVFDHMTELESKLNTKLVTPDFLNDSSALRTILLSYTEKVIQLEDKVKDMTTQTETLTKQTEVMSQELVTKHQELTVKSQEVKEMLPQVKALDRIATGTEGSLCIRDAAKALQMRPIDLTNYLKDNGWIYRRAGTHWIGYQDKVGRKLLEHKIIFIEGFSGDRIYDQVRVTAKGLASLSKEIEMSESNQTEPAPRAA